MQSKIRARTGGRSPAPAVFPFAGVSALLPRLGSPATILGVCLVTFYILRNSVLVVWPVIPGGWWTPGTYVVLLACALFLGFSGTQRLEWLGLLPVMGALLGSIFSADPRESLLRWAGWGALVVAAGPVCLGVQGQSLRDAAWRIMRLWFIAIGVVSAAWFFLRLPVLGRGEFSGLMMHCMLLGPMAGMGLVFAVAQYFQRKHWAWLAFALLSLVPCLASGSRSAVISLGVALIVLFVLRIRYAYLAWVVVLLVGALYLFVTLPDDQRQEVQLDASQESPLSDMTQELTKKGFENTREDLWKARLAEFKSHPLFGVGVGMAEGSGFAVGEEGQRYVEPGSSYLALLSMTGIVGAGSVFLMCAWIGLRVYGTFRLIPRDIFAERMAIIAYLAVHAIGEGWILAIGNPLCFVFWLTLGCLADDVRTVQLPGVGSRRRRRASAAARILEAPATAPSSGAV